MEHLFTIAVSLLVVAIVALISFPKRRMRLAVIVPVFNEEDMIGPFLLHYAGQVDRIFVLDNESTDATVRIARTYPNVEVITFKTGATFNDRIQHEEIMKCRKGCIGKFDYVIIVDCDEIVVPKIMGGVARSAARFGRYLRRKYTPPMDTGWLKGLMKISLSGLSC